MRAVCILLAMLTECTVAVLQPTVATKQVRAFSATDSADGSLDPAFGLNGFIASNISGVIRQLTLQGDKLLAWVASNQSSPPDRLIRFNTDGTLDEGFAANGVLRPPTGLGVTFQSSRGLILAGFTLGRPSSFDPNIRMPTLALSRYAYNGQPDSTFGVNGIITRELWFSDTVIPSAVLAISEWPDGRLVTIGSATIEENPGSIYSKQGLFVAHFNADGSPVTTFGADGYVVRPDPSLNLLTYALVFQQDGSFVRLGFTGNQYWANYFIARYSSIGLPLQSAQIDRRAQKVSYACSSPGSIINTPGNKILYTYHNYCQAGYPSVDEVVLSRLNADLTADPSFTQSSPLPMEVNDRPIMLQRDSKIVLVRSPQSAIGLLRLNADGSLDSSFGISGTVTTTVTPYGPNPMAVEARSHAAVVQLDGKIVVGGSYVNPNGGNLYILLARYNGTPINVTKTYIPSVAR